MARTFILIQHQLQDSHQELPWVDTIYRVYAIGDDLEDAIEDAIVGAKLRDGLSDKWYNYRAVRRTVIDEVL